MTVPPALVEVAFTDEASVIEASNLSRTTIWRLRKKGRFPSPVRVGARSLYRVEEVRAWLENPEGWSRDSQIIPRDNDHG